MSIKFTYSFENIDNNFSKKEKKNWVFAIEKGREDIVEKMIRDDQRWVKCSAISRNKIEYGELSSLGIAAAHGRTDICTLLIEHGASPYERTGDDWEFPIAIAACAKQYDTMEFFMDFGFDIASDAKRQEYFHDACGYLIKYNSKWRHDMLGIVDVDDSCVVRAIEGGHFKLFKKLLPDAHGSRVIGESACATENFFNEVVKYITPENVYEAFNITLNKCNLTGIKRLLPFVDLSTPSNCRGKGSNYYFNTAFMQNHATEVFELFDNKMPIDEKGCNSLNELGNNLLFEFVWMKKYDLAIKVAKFTDLTHRNFKNESIVDCFNSRHNYPGLPSSGDVNELCTILGIA